MRDSRKNRSRFKIVLDALKRLLGKKPAQPEDPYAYAMAPLRRGPKGRSGAAVAEIEDDQFNRYPPRKKA
jgi:hypothetical protein